MKIIPNLFVCHFIIKMVQKNSILTKKGVKIQNFENSKKVPLDISEIHVSKFGPIPMKIVAGSWPEHTHTMTTTDFWVYWPKMGSIFKISKI